MKADPLPVPVLSFTEFIAADGDRLTTTSQQVASAFGKRHDDLLKRIRVLTTNLPLDRRGYFAECLRINDLANGKPEPYFVITRDGFTFLAMGFTGKKALLFKLAYLDAFNAMEAFIRNQREGISFRSARHELACKDSKRRASTHGRGLNERRLELPVLKAEEAELLSLAQPRLFVN